MLGENENDLPVVHGGVHQRVSPIASGYQILYTGISSGDRSENAPLTFLVELPLPWCAHHGGFAPLILFYLQPNLPSSSKKNYQNQGLIGTRLLYPSFIFADLFLQSADGYFLILYLLKFFVKGCQLFLQPLYLQLLLPYFICLLCAFLRDTEE